MKTSGKRPEMIRNLVKAGKLRVEKVNRGDRYATIGYHAEEDAWYAWNAAVWNKFTIGSSVHMGNCAYVEKLGAWTAETMADAHQMAIDFAHNVARASA